MDEVPHNPCPHYRTYYIDYSIRTESSEDEAKNGLDVYRIKIHANHITLMTLGPQHPILQKIEEDGGIKKLTYSPMIVDGVDSVKGKRKKGAFVVLPGSPICTITTEKDRIFNINSPFRTKVIEYNSKLQSNPSILSSRFLDLGFLLVLMPKPFDEICLKKVMWRVANRDIDCNVVEPERDLIPMEKTWLERAINFKLDSAISERTDATDTDYKRKGGNSKAKDEILSQAERADQSDKIYEITGEKKMEN